MPDPFPIESSQGHAGSSRSSTLFRSGVLTPPPLRERIKIKPGSVVRCRTRRYLVEDVQPPMHRKVPEGGDRVVTLACMEDDAIGQRLTVFLGSEVDFEQLGR